MDGWMKIVLMMMMIIMMMNKMKINNNNNKSPAWNVFRDDDERNLLSTNHQRETSWENEHKE